MAHCHQITFFKLLKCRCANAVCYNASPTRNAFSWEMPTLVDASPSRNASLQEMPASADAVFKTMLRHSETCRQCRCFAHAKCFRTGNAGISRCCLNGNASQKRNVCNLLYNKKQITIFGIQFKTNTVRNSCQASLYNYCSWQSTCTRKNYSIKKKIGFQVYGMLKNTLL